MMSLAITLVVTLLVVGILLWGIDAMPWINANVKLMINILVIVLAALWALQLIVPFIRAALRA